MFVRTASERDLEAVHDLLVETWHDTYDAIYGVDGVAAISDRWHSVDWLRQMLRRVRSEFIVADTGSELAGVAYAVRDENESDLVELQELDVRPTMQGRGVGGMLLEEIQASFFECGRMRLEVEERNDRAVAFYEADGFVRTGRKLAARGGNASILTLEKQLR